MQRLAIIGLGIWIAAVIVVGGLLLAPHVVALPTPPATDTRLRDAVAGALPTRSGHWSAAHVMYRSCPCSRRTIAHLISRARPADLDELVVIVDDDGQAGVEDELLRAAGFVVEVITPVTLSERFHVEVVPLLVVASPDRELAYVGGYGRRKQSQVYEDVQIIDDLRERADRAPLPVFGCATSARLANAIDPLGLRRW